MATRLLHDLIILHFPELPKTSAGGIVLEAKRYYGAEDGSVPRDATVVAVGPGKWVEVKDDAGAGKYRTRREVFQPTELRPGDRVLVDAMRTQASCLDEWDGVRGDFRMVRESDVEGVLEAGVRVEVA